MGATIETRYVKAGDFMVGYDSYMLQITKTPEIIVRGEVMEIAPSNAYVRVRVTDYWRRHRYGIVSRHKPFPNMVYLINTLYDSTEGLI